jgi:hypothetical protein
VVRDFYLFYAPSSAGSASPVAFPSASSASPTTTFSQIAGSS